MIIFGALPVVKWLLILVNRIASWFGSGYYLKKGLREKRKRYIFFAVVLSVVMFFALVFIARRLGH
jgi:hypothetical protein